MRIPNWDDYELIDASCGERLERWGDKILIRPDPQVIWKTEKLDKRWQTADAHYYRSEKGGGHWEKRAKEENGWIVRYKDLSFKIGMFGFKHTGLFPEQAVNWDFLREIIKKQDKKINVLNLFAYTGGASLACAAQGATVCHVDSSKGMVSWAKENAKISNISGDSIRWIVDDCVKFVLREIRRGKKYDGIIMDPPSFGRGSNKEIWKLEENIYDFIKICENIMSPDAKFFAINSYTAGLSPSVMEYMLWTIVGKKRKGRIESGEIGLKVSSTGGILPAGSTSIWRAD